MLTDLLLHLLWKPFSYLPPLRVSLEVLAHGKLR